MKRTVFTLPILAALTLLLTGCGKAPAAETAPPAVAAPQVTAEIQAPAENAGQAAPSETAAPAAGSGRQDGERFEAVIMLEGMEETVRYEHIVNKTAGFEMDYDYEVFLRRSEADRECFISAWDDPANPENYLEVSSDPGNAELVADAISASLSDEFDLYVDRLELERAGSCIRIVASVIKGTNRMPEQLQEIYVIPAPDGCRVAAAHCFIAESEGFFRRFSYMVNTLSVLDRNEERALSDEQALSAIRRYCIAGNPELERIGRDGEYPVYWEIASSDAHEIVVLFRSYTGAQTRYYIDRVTGDCRVTEFVPGITPEEERTEEGLNVWEHLG